MNQLTWHFGFADKKNYIEPQPDGWLFQNDQIKRADEYAESAISYLNKMLIFKPSVKGKGKKNPRKKKDIETIEKWLMNVMCITTLYEPGFEKGTSKKFSTEAKEKLRLLFRGHRLELEKQTWFQTYIDDCNNPSSTSFILKDVIKKFFNYSEWMTMKNEWRRKLMSAIGIQICPYCDRQYITSYSDAKTTAELDHFFLKDKYPLFSLSLFNFIPSCHICNALFKHEKELHTYPYSPDAEGNTHFVLAPSNTTPYTEYTDLLVDLILEKNDVQFDIIQKIKDKDDAKDTQVLDGLESDIKTLRLNEVYTVHQDYVRDLLQIRRFYETSEYRKFAANLLNETIYADTGVRYPVSIDKLRLFLIGGDWIKGIDTEYIPQKRPLAKLTQAILNDEYSFLLDDKESKSKKGDKSHA